MSRFQGLICSLLLLSGHLMLHSAEELPEPRPVRRHPKTPKTTPTSESSTPSTTTSKTISSKTKAPSKTNNKPYPYDQYGMRATHAPFPPRSTYAPYVYSVGSAAPDVDLPKKKLPIDPDMFKLWARELMAYIAAPLLMPVAISNALNTPPGLPNQDSIWGRLSRSFRSAFLKRSEENGDNVQGENLFEKLKNKLKLRLIWQKLKSKQNKDQETGDGDRKDRLVQSNRILDFFRWKQHRHDPLRK